MSTSVRHEAAAYHVAHKYNVTGRTGVSWRASTSQKRLLVDEASQTDEHWTS